MQCYLSISAMLVALLFSATAGGVEVRAIALFSNKALLSIDQKQKILASGESYQGVTLISASARGAVVSINGSEYKLGVHQSIQSKFKSADRKTLRIHPDASGTYFVWGSINGQNTHFLVDTGATAVAISGDHAQMAGVDYKRGTPATALTASGPVSTWEINIDTVTVGNITLKNVGGVVLEGSEPRVALLGNSFLRRLELQRKDSVMELRKRF